MSQVSAVTEVRVESVGAIGTLGLAESFGGAVIAVRGGSAVG